MCPTPEELQQWILSKRREAMAALNKVELFWMLQHEINENLKREGLPRKMVPNLGFFIKQPLGGQPKMDHMLHDRVIEFMVALSSPTAHPHHLEQRIQHLRLLLKHFSQLHNILITVFTVMYDESPGTKKCSNHKEKKSRRILQLILLSSSSPSSFSSSPMNLTQEQEQA